MNRTKIEWVKNPDGAQGYTWNPITGCNNQIDGMCQGGSFPCYAYRLANGRLKDRYLANKNTATKNYDEDSYPFYPRFWTDRLTILGGKSPSSHYERRGIFVCNMGELFGDWIPREWQDKIFWEINHNPRHRFYLLTKQPRNLEKFSPFPDNCWVGVTATNTPMFVEAMDSIYNIEAKVKYLSLEPLLDWRVDPFILEKDFKAQQLDWLIIGAQTKPTIYPRIECVQEIVEACDKAGVKVFLKDNLRTLLVDALAEKLVDKSTFFVKGEGYGWDLRQEMP